MQIINFFKMNDWPINKFIRVIFSFQITILGIIGLELINIHIPLLREVISFVYLLFIPGILILRILKLHNFSNTEVLLYSAGLSVTSLMFMGFLINIIYPLFNILNPISFFYVIITIFIFVVILSILSYIRDKDFSNPEYFNTKDLPVKMVFLYLIPFLAIIGTYLMNYYQDNILLMVMIPLIAIIPILVAFDKIPEKLYPSLVFVIAISLLFHTSLISSYIWGWDINVEYYFASSVINNAYWNMQISSNVNAMLSITMLAPILSKISGMDLVWVFKIIYPLLFSLVPLGLYMVFKDQSNEKIAFLSIFFFMGIFTFFREMNQLCRQEIAEIFFLLLIMLMINLKMNKMKRSILFVIFAFSLIVSHYGLSYIYMIMLVVAISIIYLLQISKLKLIILKVRNKLFKLNIKDYHITQNKLTSSFVVLFIIFGLSWYIYVSGSAFETIVGIGNHVLSSISTDLLSSDTSQGLNTLNAGVSSPLHKIPQYLNLLFQFFIVIGVLSTLKSINKFKLEYVIFVFVSLFILILSVILPYFASSLSMTRIYHIVLFFLAPFAIIGGVYSFKILYKLVRRSWTKNQVNNSLKLISLLLSVLFLFFTGFIYEVNQDEPTSFSLNKNVDYSVFNNPEVLSIKWLHDMKRNELIYADAYRYTLLIGFEQNKIAILSSSYDLSKNGYLFLGDYNIKTGTVFISNKENAVTTQSYISDNSFILNKNRIYENGYSNIYYN